MSLIWKKKNKKIQLEFVYKACRKIGFHIEEKLYNVGTAVLYNYSYS